VNHRRLATCFLSLFATALVAAGVGAQSQPTTAAALPDSWNLQVCGSANRIWYALSSPIVDNPTPHTYIRSRAMQEPWEELVDFPNRVLAMTSNGVELMVSMEGGEWARIAGQQFVSGPPLPGRTDMLGLAADEQAVWAVGWVNPSASTTVPATDTSSGPVITTKPAGPGEWGLFRLEGDHWNLITGLPHDLPVLQDGDVSLMLLNHVPILAFRHTAKSVEIIRCSADTWNTLGTIICPFAIRKMSLLELDGKLLVWAAGDAGAGELFFQESGAWKSKSLAFAAPFTVVDSAVAAFNGELRLLAIGAHEQFQEQRFDAVGQPIGKITEIEKPASSDEITPHALLNWSALALLIIITLASTQRASMLKQVKVKTGLITLAPLTLRLSAGLIDLWPFYVLTFLLVGHVHRGLLPSEIRFDRFSLWALAVSAAIYVLHPLIAEWIWGRSLGKMFVGLSVVATDGQTPARGAILLRNLLRVIEGPALLGVPLLAIYFTPLRQRVGDMLAGTLVVTKNPADTDKGESL
jgi:uncharacterized RDD family membrane protein YckC